MDRLKGLRILVVEDELLVALGLQDMLREFGCESLGPFSRLGDAITAIDSGDFDCAILDVNVRGERSMAAAHMLRDNGVPFLFSTGYGERIGDFPDVPVLQKPYAPDALRDALLTALGLAPSSR